MLFRLSTLSRRHGFRIAFPRKNVRFTTTQAPQSRISRIESRLPSFLRRYTTPLRTAPVSHITAFLILHEITAIVPLLGLTGAFHYLDWLPPYITEGALVKQGTEKFGRYLRKKGWIDDDSVRIGSEAGESGVRIVVELATAYAITKALLPLRLVLSVWAAPWFARRTVLPVVQLFKGVAGKSVLSPAAGTNAIGGGAIPRALGKV